MDHRGSLLVGGVLIIVGLLALLGAIFHINFWELCWPAGLITLGLILLTRPRWILPGVGLRFLPVGDITRDGQWPVQSEEFSTFVSDIELDFSETQIPDGETVYRIDGFVIGCKVTLPENVAISIQSSAFTTDAHVLNEKSDAFMTTYKKSSPDYESANTKIKLIFNAFVVDLSVKMTVRRAASESSSGGQK